MNIQESAILPRRAVTFGTTLNDGQHIKEVSTMKTSMHSKPSIVFAHGIWADGSCFQKLIPPLRAEGHEVMAAQYGLDTLKGDVDATIRTFGRVSGPIVLVGHSYGGTVITHAGVDRRVAALVYIAGPAGQVPEDGRLRVRRSRGRPCLDACGRRRVLRRRPVSRRAGGRLCD